MSLARGGKSGGNNERTDGVRLEVPDAGEGVEVPDLDHAALMPREEGVVPDGDGEDGVGDAVERCDWQ